MATTLFYSSRCEHCKKFIEALSAMPDLANSITPANIDGGDFPEWLRAVPAVFDGSQVFEGPGAFAWLKKKREEAPSPFSYDRTGPSPTTEFSYLEEEVAYGHRQSAFESFKDTEDEPGTGPPAGSQGGALEGLLEKRRGEVPQPIHRQ